MRTSRISRRLIGLSALMLAAAGCFLLPPDEERVVATVRDVQLPDSVRQGQSFMVRITTAGGGCMRQGDDEVQVEGNTADITPYDIIITPRDGSGCNLFAVDYHHVVGLAFPAVGSGVVVVHGRDKFDAPVEYPYTVVVEQAGM